MLKHGIAGALIFVCANACAKGLTHKTKKLDELANSMADQDRADPYSNQIYNYGTLDIEQSGFNIGLSGSYTRAQFELFRASYDWNNPQQFFVDQEIVCTAAEVVSAIKTVFGVGTMKSRWAKRLGASFKQTEIGYSVGLMGSGALFTARWRY
jgi:hypothetical protein